MASDLPNKLLLRVVSADRSLVNEQVDEVEVPGSEGYFGVLPGHDHVGAHILQLSIEVLLEHRIGQTLLQLA